jgi:hypothetical protein
VLTRTEGASCLESTFTDLQLFHKCKLTLCRECSINKNNNIKLQKLTTREVDVLVKRKRCTKSENNFLKDTAVFDSDYESACFA